MAERRRQAVSLAIEGAALDLFSSRPVAEVTVEEIAVKAGVAVRTLYRYFATKEDVFAGYPRRQAQRLAERVRARPAKEPPFDALRNAALEAGQDVDRDELDRWMAALAHAEGTNRIGRAALGAMTAALTEALAERIGQEPDDLGPAMAGAMAAGAMVVATRQWATKGGDLVAHQLAALDMAGRGIMELATQTRP